VAIRIESIPKGKTTVLELFSGKVEIWRAIKARTGREIKTIRIDQKKIPDAIKGDNRKLIPNLNLSKYNIIDCDAYGDSSDQIRLLMDNSTLNAGTVIHYTYNRVSMGGGKYSLLSEIGIRKEMIKKCPSLFARLAYDGFLEFLRKKGIKQIHEIQNDHKGGKGRRIGRYGYFIVVKKPKT